MKRKSFIIVCASLLFLAACAVWKGPGLTAAEDLFKGQKYGEAIAAYRKIQQDNPDSPAAGEANFNVAYILVYIDNPHRDYAFALKEFDEFLKRYPDHERASEARTWRQALKTLHDAKRELDALKKSIEQLKKLDIRHEEKRKMR